MLVFLSKQNNVFIMFIKYAIAYIRNDGVVCLF